jgi:hypothetical protein
VKRCLTIAGLLAIWAGAVSAATLERLTLDEMIAKSTAIVRGSVTGVRTTFTGRDIYTHYRIAVEERFKGVPQQSVEITVHGGSYGAYHQTSPGSPVLNQGDRYVFFLWTGNSGVTWITGMTQGLFQLNGSEPSDPMATRAVSRELMLDPGTARPVKDSAVSLKLSELRARIAAVGARGSAQ